MSDNLQFRIWDNKEKKWVEATQPSGEIWRRYIAMDGSVVEILTSRSARMTMEWRPEALRYEISQYIGRSDSKGVKAFTGDTIEFKIEGKTEGGEIELSGLGAFLAKEKQGVGCWNIPPIFTIIGNKWEGLLHPQKEPPKEEEKPSAGYYENIVRKINDKRFIPDEIKCSGIDMERTDPGDYGYMAAVTSGRMKLIKSYYSPHPITDAQKDNQWEALFRCLLFRAYYLTEDTGGNGYIQHHASNLNSLKVGDRFLESEFEEICLEVVKIGKRMVRCNRRPWPIPSEEEEKLNAHAQAEYGRSPLGVFEEMSIALLLDKGHYTRVQ